MMPLPMPETTLKRVIRRRTPDAEMRVTIRLSRHDHKRLHARADAEGRTAVSIIREALRLMLDATDEIPAAIARPVTEA